jgi:hypothetical protein
VKDQHARGLLSPGKRENHHWWKGGTTIDAKGYVLITLDNDPSGRIQKAEHILVAERMIGRKLTKNEVVHHKDENRKNNAESNLQVMTRGEHTKLHHAMRHHPRIPSGEIE